MVHRLQKPVTLFLSIFCLTLLPACPFGGIGIDIGNDNSNTNDNGNDNGDDQTDFAVFVDPDSDFSTTDVNDIDYETIKFRISNEAIVYQDGTEYQAGSWPVDGNSLAGGGFTVRFGTENGERKAYFTETGPGTICDYVVTPTTFSVAPTSQTPPQE